MSVRVHIALCLALLACACGGDDPPVCIDTDAAGPTVPGAVMLGTGAADQFQVISAGESLELEFGTQGGWMVRPVLQIDAATLGVDDGCVGVRLEAEIPGITPVPSTQLFPELHRTAGFAYTDPIIVFLAFDLESVRGQMCTLRATAVGGAAASTTSVQVVLVDNQ